MGLLSFIKEAGEKLFGSAHAAQPGTAPAAAGAANQAIIDYIHAMKLDAQNLAVEFNPSTGVVDVSGQAPDQQTREKIVLCCGNVSGVSLVNDNMTTAGGTSESRWYEVVKGNTLSKIAKDMYGDASKYPQIFEANKPMLSNPDKIYPGQKLRIPAA